MNKLIIIIIIINRFITSFINILKYIHSSISRLKQHEIQKNSSTTLTAYMV